ncbi:MAG: hypothetical protein JRH20_32600, partial [Deltaproteobacteria bacterium]|nr:hypothetical protein [Deltaproteobacteria bacterium]
SEDNALTEKYGPTPWTKAPAAPNMLLDLYLYDKAKAGKTEAGDLFVSARIKVVSQRPWTDHLKEGHRWDSATFW